MTKSPDEIFGTVAAKLLNLVKLTGDSQITFRLGEITSDLELEFVGTKRVLKRLVEKDKAIKILGLHLSNPDRRFFDIEDVPTEELERAISGKGRSVEEQSAWATKEVLGVDYAYDYHDQITVEVDSEALKMAIRNFGAAEKTFSQNMMEGAIRTIQEQQDAIKNVQWERGVVASGSATTSSTSDNKSQPLNSNQIGTLLESRYQDITNHAHSNWDFFLYLADYVKFIDDTPELKNVVQTIQQQRVRDFTELNKLEQKLQKEVEEAHEKLITIVQDKEIPTEIVKENLKEYKDYKERRILSSQPLAESLFDCVVEALRALHHKGYGKEIEDFIEDEKSGTSPEIRQFIFAPSLRAYHEEKEEVEIRKKSSIWFAWNELAIAYLSVFSAQKTQKDLMAEERRWENLNFLGIVGEMRDIMNRKDFAQHQPVQFIRTDYEQYVNRVHRFFLQQLISVPFETKKVQTPQTPNPSILRNKRDALLKVKRILDYIQSKREIAPKDKRGFMIRLTEFLEAGRGLIKLENDVESILEKIAQESKAITVHAEYATDDIDSWRIYIISVIKVDALNKYHQQILDEYDRIEPQFQQLKAGAITNEIKPQDTNDTSILDSSFVEAEKRKALSITTIPDHKLLLERWQKINGILSAIFQQIPPLSPSTKVPIKVDLSMFPKHYVEDVLQFLMKQKVLGYLDYDKDSGVITTKYLRQYLEGQNILVLNREAFENYKISVSILCSFIEKDWEHRFTDTPSLRKSLLQELRKPTGVTSQKEATVGEVASFSYNPETGDGELRGTPTKRLKDGTPERLLFDEAFRNRGRKVPKSEVIRVLGIDTDTGNTEVEPTAVLSALGDSTKHRKNSKDVQITNKINLAVKEVRNKLGVNTKEFVNNGGNVTFTL